MFSTIFFIVLFATFSYFFVKEAIFLSLFDAIVYIPVSYTHLITAVIRQVINVAYLAAVYFVSSAVLSSVVYPLVGAVVGLTVPMFIFTFKLVKKNDSAEK